LRRIALRVGGVLAGVAVAVFALASPPAAPPSPPRIRVGSLTDDNNGRLHGAWIDASQDPEDLHHAIKAMLRLSRFPDAEEWGIFDYEGFGSLRLDEYEWMDTLSRIAKGIEKHGPAFEAWVEYVGTDSAE